MGDIENYGRSTGIVNPKEIFRQGWRLAAGGIHVCSLSLDLARSLARYCFLEELIKLTDGAVPIGNRRNFYLEIYMLVLTYIHVLQISKECTCTFFTLPIA